MSDTLLNYGIKNLKNGSNLTIYHPLLNGIELYIQKEHTVMSVLGIPTKMYGEKYIVSDNADTIHNDHEVLLSADNMENYIQTLCQTTTKKEYHYVRKLKEKGLQIGSKIEFEDGKQGVITPLSEDCPDVLRALFYLPLKKDGKESKVKPRILYGGTIYKVIE